MNKPILTLSWANALIPAKDANANIPITSRLLTLCIPFAFFKELKRVVKSKGLKSKLCK